MPEARMLHIVVIVNLPDCKVSVRERDSSRFACEAGILRFFSGLAFDLASLSACKAACCFLSKPLAPARF